MKDAFVTGATGFIGRHLVHELYASGVHVYSVVRDVRKANEEGLNCYSDIIECPLESISDLPSKVGKVSESVFYHLAWHGGTNASNLQFDLQASNIQASIACMEAASFIESRRFIGIGSVLDLTANQILQHRITHPSAAYAVAKDAIHKLLTLLSQANGMQFTWCRFAGVYGRDDRTKNLISYVIEQLQRGVSPTIGQGHQIYSFAHVDDVARALVLIGEIETDLKQEYMICGSESMSIRSYLEILNDIVEPNLTIEYGKRADDGVRYDEEWFKSSIFDDLGFCYKYSFAEGIKSIIGDTHE